MSSILLITTGLQDIYIESREWHNWSQLSKTRVDNPVATGFSAFDL